MVQILKKLWRALLVFWTVLGAIVSIVLIIGIYVSSSYFSRTQASSQITTEEYCEKYKVGVAFKAIEIPSGIQNVKYRLGQLISSVGSVHFRPLEKGLPTENTGLAVFQKVDAQGAFATLSITDTVLLLKKTCWIEFEKGTVVSVKYRTWD